MLWLGLSPNCFWGVGNNPSTEMGIKLAKCLSPFWRMQLWVSCKPLEHETSPTLQLWMTDRWLQNFIHPLASGSELSNPKIILSWLNLFLATRRKTVSPYVLSIMKGSFPILKTVICILPFTNVQLSTAASMGRQEVPWPADAPRSKGLEVDNRFSKWCMATAIQVI